MIKHLVYRMRSFSAKSYWRETLAVLMMLLAFVFFRSERRELIAIIPHIRQAAPFWLFLAFLITIISIFLQGGMYRKSFAAIGLSLKWKQALILFLKRNFLGVFLPAGGVSALAYSPAQIRKAGFNKIQVHQASGLFGFAGLLTVFIAGLPVIIYTLFIKGVIKNSWIGLLLILIIITLLFETVRSIKQKKALYNWIDRRFPSITPTLNELFAVNINAKQFSGA